MAISLLPTLPLALCVSVQLVAAPALVLVDDESVLDRHVSGWMLSSAGYSIRTFDAQAALDQGGRSSVGAPLRMAVHRDLKTFSTRVHRSYCGLPLREVWNHVENLAEEELLAFNAVGSSAGRARPGSATIRLPGSPPGVALVWSGGDQAVVGKILEAIGLRYSGAG